MFHIHSPVSAAMHYLFWLIISAGMFWFWTHTSDDVHQLVVVLLGFACLVIGVAYAPLLVQCLMMLAVTFRFSAMSLD